MRVHNQLVPDAGVTILSLLVLHLMDLTVPVKRGMVAPMMIFDCLENIMTYDGMKEANFDIVVTIQSEDQVNTQIKQAYKFNKANIFSK